MEYNKGMEGAAQRRMDDTNSLDIELLTSRYAIKALDKNHADFDLPSLEKEVMILKKVTSPNPLSSP